MSPMQMPDRGLASTFLRGHRHKRREPDRALTGSRPEGWPAGTDPLRGPAACAEAEAEALSRLTDADILAALRDLPEELRVAICLADIEGYRYREIANITGTPVGTVMGRLHRGRGTLRRRLAV
jgi:RNA polymerase sigma-70 factor (ECF subfamily)